MYVAREGIVVTTPLMVARSLLAVTLCLGATVAPGPAPAQTFVTVAEAAAFSAATWVDAGACLGIGRGVADAVCFPWASTAAAANTGLLADDDTLRARFDALGVSAATPVIVYGDWRSGWGEEGRVWWTLRYLGHQQVYIVEGGFDALSRAQIELRSVRASFSDWPETRDDTRTLLPALTANAVAEATVVLDTRTADEFGGATLFQEARGGHIERAVHLEWRDLIADDGLLDEATVRSELAAIGISRDTSVVTYCTGGVRSAFAVAVLEHLGIHASNYDGSWWEYAELVPARAAED